MPLYDSLLKELPVMPPVAARILALTEEGGDVSFRKLEETISLDPMLASRILKAANSAMYARQKEISTIRAAIALLGYKTIRSLVILIGASSMFHREASSPFYSRFWRHSLLTAFLSKECASQTILSGRKDELFLAGLLHDIGQVAMYHGDRKGYEELITERDAGNRSMKELEQARFGTDHHQLGGAILTEWNFPAIFVDAAKEHGSLNVHSQYKSAVLAITLSDIIALKAAGIPVNDEKRELLSTLPGLLPVESGIVSYLERQFPRLIEQDPFFQECAALLSLKPSA